MGYNVEKYTKINACLTARDWGLGIRDWMLK
jgi:hypothetical protein